MSVISSTKTFCHEDSTSLSGHSTSDNIVDYYSCYGEKDFKAREFGFLFLNTCKFKWISFSEYFINHCINVREISDLKNLTK